MQIGCVANKILFAQKIVFNLSRIKINEYISDGSALSIDRIHGVSHSPSDRKQYPPRSRRHARELLLQGVDNFRR